MGQCQRSKQRGEEDNTTHCLLQCDFGVTDLEKMKRKGLKVPHTSNYCQIYGSNMISVVIQTMALSPYRWEKNSLLGLVVTLKNQDTVEPRSSEDEGT